MNLGRKRRTPDTDDRRDLSSPRGVGDPRASFISSSCLMSHGRERFPFGVIREVDEVDPASSSPVVSMLIQVHAHARDEQWDTTLRPHAGLIPRHSIGG